jgi:hypothetical protein
VSEGVKKKKTGQNSGGGGGGLAGSFKNYMKSIGPQIGYIAMIAAGIAVIVATIALAVN